jgi:hypothetical protein
LFHTPGIARRSLLAFIGASFLGVFLSTPSCAQGQHPARPDSINYVEGEASIGAQALRSDSPGSVALEKDQILTTKAGKVEILLTPGVFLRVADNSSVKIVSPDLADTEVLLEKGRADVEVLDILKENNIRINENDASTKLLNMGLYDFDADHAQVRVFKGRAEVYAGGQEITLMGEQELTLNTTGKPKAHNFDTRQYEDDFFRWCALRSGYYRKLASTPRAHTLALDPVGTDRAGMALGGIGILGFPSIPFFRQMESSTVHLDGASIRRSSSIGLLSFSTVTTGTSLIISTNSIIRMDTDLSRREDFVGEGSMAQPPARVAARSCGRHPMQEDEVKCDENFRRHL